MVVCAVGEQSQGLRDRRADLVFVPASDGSLSGLDTEGLLILAQVAVMPRRDRRTRCGAA